MTITRENSALPATKIIKMVSGVDYGPLYGPTRGLAVTVPNDATLIDAEGNAADGFPLQAGYNNIRVTKVTTANNNDFGVWGLW